MEPVPKHCLLCSNNVELNSCSPLRGTFPGGNDCPLLERELEQLFILHNLLDIPSSFCQGILARRDSHDNRDPFQFGICSNCYSSKVLIAWKIHQQTLALEEKMRKLKKMIREEMKIQFEKDVDDTNRGIEDEIRKFVFTDATNTKQWIADSDVKVEVTTFSDDDDNFDDVDSSFSHKPEDFVLKRKRGRPKGTGSKPDGRVKKKKLRTDSDDDYDEDAISNYSLELEDTFKQSPTKRKRGRPKRTDTKPDVKVKQRNNEQDEDAMSNLESEDSFKLKNSPRKKKRGRPKRTENESGSGDHPIKRKRGRPKRIDDGTYKKPARKPGSSKLFYKTRHGVLKRKSFHWVFCPLCPSKFRTPEDLETHQQAHKFSLENGGQFDCPQCFFPSSSLNDLERHQRHRHMSSSGAKSLLKKIHHCSICTSFKTNNWRMLKLHCEQEHPALVDELLATCELCSKSFRTFQALSFHMGREHTEKPKVEVDKVEKVVEVISCDQCTMKFPSRASLLNHLQATHERKNRYICTECGKGFQYSKKLDQHMVTHEKEGRRDFICHLCGCDYPVERSLIGHYRSVHPGESEGGAKSTAGGGGASSTDNSENEFKCKYCHLTSPFKVVILRHMETHKKELGHQCQICFKSYINAQGLKRHVRISHPVTKETVECPYCNKVFTNVDYMKGHIRQFCKLKDFEENSSESSSAAAAATSSNNSQLDQIEMDVGETKYIETKYF